MSITVTMLRKKETKGAVQFEEPGFPNRGQYKIGTLYMRKDDLLAQGNLNAAEITVTVEVTK